MASAEQYADWIIKNQDKKGSPEFEAVAQAYKLARTQASAPKAYDPTDDMSDMQKGLAGVGKAFVDVGRGVGQMVGFVSRDDIKKARELDASLMNTTAGTVGNVVGNVAALAPAALIPGANTMAGAATIGAVSGLLAPSASTGETLSNIGINAALGPAAILAGRGLAAGYQGVKALAEPFYKSGQDKIAARTLQSFASNAKAASQSARGAGQSVVGSMPTTAEATKDVGLAQLQRALQSADPVGFGTQLAERLTANNAARVNALRNIAQTPEAREAALQAADAQAKRLYGAAFKEGIEVTPELARLAARPSMRRAEARAIGLADELGIPFQAPLADMRPKFIQMGAREIPPATVVQSIERQVPITDKALNLGSPQQFATAIEEQAKRIPLGRGLPSYFEVPPVDSVPVRDLHTIKMGMDAMLSDPTLGIAGREAAALTRTRGQLLDMLPESYQVARNAHIEAMKPVNQMDIGNRLLRQFSSATKDLEGNPRLRAEAFNRALQDEAGLVKKATGVRGIGELSDVMTPEQMRAISAIADELGLQSAIAEAGKAVGSNTAQNLATKNILRQIIGPTGLPESWAENTLLTTLMRPIQFAAKAGEGKVTNRLSQALLNPQEAATLLEMTARPELSARFGQAALPWLAPVTVGVANSKQ